MEYKSITSVLKEIREVINEMEPDHRITFLDGVIFGRNLASSNPIKDNEDCQTNISHITWAKAVDCKTPVAKEKSKENVGNCLPEGYAKVNNSGYLYIGKKTFDKYNMGRFTTCDILSISKYGRDIDIIFYSVEEKEAGTYGDIDLSLPNGRAISFKLPSNVKKGLYKVAYRGRDCFEFKYEEATQ